MKTPSLYKHLESCPTLGHAFLHVAAADPLASVLRYPVASSAESTRIWRTVSYADMVEKVSRTAHFLHSKGVGLGTPVAIISNSRLEWMVTDMAIQLLGGITVSIYQSLTPEEAGFILYDSGAKIVCIENQEQLTKIGWLSSNDCLIPEREKQPAESTRIPIDLVVTFEPLTKQETPTTLKAPLFSFTEITEDSTYPKEPPPIPQRLNRHSTSSYVYTSGTTGPPKGVIQSHGNHLVNVLQASMCGVFGGDTELFLYLPLAHSFARLIYHAGFITSTSLVLPAVIDHKSSRLDLSSIARDIRESNCEVLPSVPRLFEKMAAAVRAKATTKGLQGYLMRYCLSNAEKIQHCRENGLPGPIGSSILYDMFKPIRLKISSQLFGNSLKHAISGGARLDPSVIRFFDGLGVTICEGYGLTETAVATHVNVPSSRKIGSVGRSFPELEVRIHPDDHEISVRGPNVAHGYLNRPTATAESWTDDGWFHTGDVGRVDDEGFLFITDRKKELVITAGGKKIPPSSIEGLFKNSSFVSHAFFYGEGKPYCVALLTLNEPEVRVSLRALNISVPENAPLSEHPFVASQIERVVNDINSKLASYETIKKFAILSEDFTIENGLLTPTLKMKRRKITERFISDIQKLYEE